jgi:hypothetical protein
MKPYSKTKRAVSYIVEILIENEVTCAEDEDRNQTETGAVSRQATQRSVEHVDPRDGLPLPAKTPRL